MSFALREEKLKGPESSVELVRDKHDPTLSIIDRIGDFSGGVNFRDYNLIKDNQSALLQNAYPDDIFRGRRGYTAYNGTAISGINRISDITRYYLDTTSQHLICVVDRDTNDKVYYGNDTTGAMTELTGGTALTSGQKYTLVTYRDNLFFASENQALQVSTNGTTKADCGGSLPANANYILVVHENRLWNLGDSDNPNTLYYTSAGGMTGGTDPTSDMDFDGGGTIDINLGDGDYIVGAISFYRVLWVFKRNYIVQLFGDARFNFTPVYPPIHKGAVGHKAICKSGNQVYFVSWDGVYSVDSAGTLKNISQNIQPIFQDYGHAEWRMNKSYIEKTVLFYYDGYIWMSYPAGSSTVPDRVMIFDPERDGWFPQKGMDINCAVVQDGYSDEYELRTGSASTGKIWKMNEGFSDNTSAIEFRLKTKFRDQKMPERFKQYLSLTTDIKTTQAGDVTAYIDTYGDIVQVSTVAATTSGIKWGDVKWGEAYWATDSSQSTTLPINQPMRGPKIAIELIYSGTTSKLEVRSLSIIAKPEMLRR